MSFSPMLSGYGLRQSFQGFLLIRSQVVRFTFVVNENHINRPIQQNEVVNHSRAAALAFSPRGHPNFPQTARALNDLALCRIFHQLRLKSGIGLIIDQLDNALGKNLRLDESEDFCHL